MCAWLGGLLLLGSAAAPATAFRLIDRRDPARAAAGDTYIAAPSARRSSPTAAPRVGAARRYWAMMMPMQEPPPARARARSHWDPYHPVKASRRRP
eukprot:SAG31_NODE_1582_length_7828_cov_9.088110_7_plen_96_part_00